MAAGHYESNCTACVARGDPCASPLPAPVLRCAWMRDRPRTVEGEQAWALAFAPGVVRVGPAGATGLDVREAMARAPDADAAVFRLMAAIEIGLMAGWAERRERKDG